MKSMFANLFVSIILIGCASNEATLPIADFKVAKNETFKINLTSNASTGYTWKWSNKKEIDIVDTLNTSYKPLNLDPQVLGSSGTEIWNFKAIKSGTQILKLEYSRSWENNSTIETKTFIVNVK